MERLQKNRVGIAFVMMQTILTFALLAVALYVDVIPNRYMFLLAVVLLGLLAYAFVSQIRQKGRIVGRNVSGLVDVLMVVALCFLVRGYVAILGVSDSTTQVSEMSILVLREDPARSIADAVDYSFGIVGDMDRERTDQTLFAIQEKYGERIDEKEYEDVISLVEALYAKEVGAILFNEAFRASVLDDHEGFDAETRVLGNHEVIDVVGEEEEGEKEEEKANLTNAPFHIYISGLDIYGSVKTKSRSDVNIIATVNPLTKQILLTSTPRDFYVSLPNANGAKDKLTHAGVYGVDVSMRTLEMLYDIEINDYVLMNFSGFVKLVDSLGGVKVYSEYAFRSDWGPSFLKGYNKVDGRRALPFVRQRKNLPGGDRQRGKNQMAMVQAIVKKAASPAVLANYNGLMDGLEGTFRTSVSSSHIRKFVKFQMDGTWKWNITANSVDGVGASERTYSYRSRRSYVMKPLEESVGQAKDLMNRVMEGEVLANPEKM